MGCPKSAEETKQYIVINATVKNEPQALAERKPVVVKLASSKRLRAAARGRSASGLATLECKTTHGLPKKQQRNLNHTSTVVVAAAAATAARAAAAATAAAAVHQQEQQQ